MWLPLVKKEKIITIYCYYLLQWKGERKKIFLTFYSWELKLLDTRNVEMHVNQYCPDLLKKKKTKNREEVDTDDRETMTRWKMSSMEKKSMCIFVNCSINYLVWLYKYVKRVLYIILLYKNGFLFNLGLFHEVAVNKNAEVRVLSSSDSWRLSER